MITFFETLGLAIGLLILFYVALWLLPVLVVACAIDTLINKIKGNKEKENKENGEE